MTTFASAYEASMRPVRAVREARDAAANRLTYSRAKAEAMGFEFGHVRVQDDPLRGGIRLIVHFACVCGRVEYYIGDYHAATVSPDGWDVAKELWDFGSFSREHLLKDGYSSEQCDEFERKAEEFDRIHRHSFCMQERV
jgi:hypothetical protein